MGKPTGFMEYKREVSGFVQNVVICLVIGILLTLATLLVLKRVFGQKAATQQ